MRPRGRRPWSSGRRGGSRKHDFGGQQSWPDALHAVRGRLNADRFIVFLRRLTKDAGQKVFLIVDNLKVHHAAKIKTWVANHVLEIELCYCTPRTTTPTNI